MSEKISFYSRLENWKDGSIRYVERYSKGTKDSTGKSLGGRYKTITDNIKFYQGQKVGVWQNEDNKKVVNSINHSKYVRGEFFRASICLNVPFQGTITKPNYKNFTFVIIDKKENINMEDMYKKLIKEVEQSLHYPQSEFWFNSSISDCNQQQATPYSANSSSETFEGTDY